MKKIAAFAGVLFLLVGLTGCLREEAPTPDDLWGPSTAMISLSLTAQPSTVMAFDPLRNPAPDISLLKAKLVHFKKGPLPKRNIIFMIAGYKLEYTPPEDYTCVYGPLGKLNKNQDSVRATTDENGVATATYYPPDKHAMTVYCYKEDSEGNIIDEYSFAPSEVVIYIKAYYQGQSWPEGGLSMVYGIVPIRVVR